MKRIRVQVDFDMPETLEELVKAHDPEMISILPSVMRDKSSTNTTINYIDITESEPFLVEDKAVCIP